MTQISFGGAFAEAFACEVQAVGAMHEPVENGVGHRRVGDHFVPVFDVDLTGHDGAATARTIVENLQQVAALFGRHVGKTPIVQDQQLAAGDGLEQSRMTAIASMRSMASP